IKYRYNILIKNDRDGKQRNMRIPMISFRYVADFLFEHKTEQF
ncbi:hypothetical protein GWI33_010712, partial [Rhynchophorus ferrugineus]